MFVVLPLLTFLFLFMFRFGRDDWRLAALKAAVVCGVLITATTEILSLFAALNRPAVAICWGAAAVSAAALCWWRRDELLIRARWFRPAPSVVLAVAPLAVLMGCLLVVAVVAPAPNPDSLNFHLPRVAHWVANQSVASFPSEIEGQLWEPPWSAYLETHLQLLLGNDRLVNLAAWLSLAGCLVAASLVAQRLGAPVRGQVLAAVVMGTMPEAIMEATSTLNDLSLGFWTLASIAFALLFIARPGPASAGWFASALGLAMLAKTGAYLVAAPLVFLVGYWVLSRLRIRRGLLPGLIMLTIPIAINAGYLGRNLALYHSPFASASTDVAINKNLNLASFESNAIKDLTLQLGTPFPQVNKWMYTTVVDFHRDVLHYDVNGTTAWGGPHSWGIPFQVNLMSTEEGSAGDPLQTLLIMAAVPIGLLYGLWRRAPLVALYAVGLTMSAAIFVGYIRWQSSATRYELWVLVLGGPIVGVVVARLPRLAAVSLGALLLLASIPWVTDAAGRPMLPFAITIPGTSTSLTHFLPPGQDIFNTPRSQLWALGENRYHYRYQLVADRARQTGCRRIAFYYRPLLDGDPREYLLWVALQPLGGDVRIDDVGVNNLTAATSRAPIRDCLLAVLSPDPAAAEVRLDGILYDRTDVSGYVAVYKPSP